MVRLSIVLIHVTDGIPKLLHCGTEGDYNVLVLELLGPNLEDILNYCDHKLSLKTVIMLSDQLVTIETSDVVTKYRSKEWKRYTTGGSSIETSNQIIS